MRSGEKPRTGRPSKKRSSARLRKNLEAQLAGLESAELIRRILEEEPTFIFKHVLTQETACGSLLLKTRRKIHRQVARSIEQVYADRLDENAALLAQHYAEAGDDAKTFHYAIRAGDLAARVYANAEALQQYARALDAARRRPAHRGDDGATDPSVHPARACARSDGKICRGARRL